MQTGLLNEEQREEWKGWMQLVILVYQMTGAAGVIPIRLLVHTLTSAHLFLLGYEHFAYHFHTADFSLLRFLRVTQPTPLSTSYTRSSVCRCSCDTTSWRVSCV